MKQIAILILLGAILWFGFSYLVGYARQPSFSLEASSPDLTIDGQSVSHVFRFTAAQVVDGDSVRVSGAGIDPFDVRLASIDAPELQQFYGLESKQYLDRLLSSQSIVAWQTGTDQYGRRIAFLFAEQSDGQLREINAQMVRDGYAWHYSQYSNSATLESLQYEARAARIGLWNTAQAPVPPWEFRR